MGDPARGLAGHGGGAQGRAGSSAGGTDLGTSPCLAVCLSPEPSVWGAAVGPCLSLPTHHSAGASSSPIIRVSGHLGAGLGREHVPKQTVLPDAGTPGAPRCIGVMPRPRRLARLIVCRRVYCSAPSSLFHPCLVPPALPFAPGPGRSPRRARSRAALAPDVVPRPSDYFARWRRCQCPTVVPAASP